MNVQLQKCNVCSGLNTTEDKAWVRVLGAGNGGVRQHQGQADFCPTCAAKTTVDALPAICAPPIVQPIVRQPGRAVGHIPEPTASNLAAIVGMPIPPTRETPAES